MSLGFCRATNTPRLLGDEDGDVTNDLTYDGLVAGCADQIPYLVDTDRGVTLYESDDIVVYLETYYA